MDINVMYKKYKNNEIDFEKVSECCVPIIANILKSNGAYKVSKEDYHQEGLIILLECLSSYKENDNYSFYTYLYNNLKWGLNKYSFLDSVIKKPYYLYNNNIDKTKIDVSGLMVKTENGEVDILEIRDYIPSFEDNIISNIDAKEKINALSNYDIKILELMYQGYSQPKISKILNVSKSKIQRHVRNIKNKFIGLWDKNEINLLKLNMCFSNEELAYALDKDIREVEYAKSMIIREKNIKKC